MGDAASHYVGVDVGGTKIYAGVFDAGLHCVGQARISTKSQRGPEAVMERIARCVREAVDECDLDLKSVRGIGVGAPGAVDTESGRVIFAPNLPKWEDIPLKKELEKHLEVPVFIENDCNMSTLGVYEMELQAKPRHVVGIFLGTGSGAGLILNGELYSGFNRTAGEIGHMVMEVGGPKCACGNRGCFEALASRTALFTQIHTAVQAGQKSILTDLLGKDLKDMRSGDLRKAIRRGDKFVEKLVQTAARYTGLAVGNVINLLNPEVVMLGGGLVEALEDEMMGIIVEAARQQALPGTAKGIVIKASKLGDEAGINGGAVLARTGLGKR
jgi:glucokinase